MSMVIDGKSGFFIKNYYVNRHGIMHYFGVKKTVMQEVLSNVYMIIFVWAQNLFL